MTVGEFVAKWQNVQLTERAAAQSHFLDLCALVGHPSPTTADPTGETFCFEKGVEKQGGGDGWADVWKRHCFGWEYKGKHKDLEAAYRQILLYREALENPPLLVVCDMDRLIVRTNFTNTQARRYEIPLEELGEPENLRVLRAVFFEPSTLRPGSTREAITKEAAERLARVAESLRGRGLDPHRVAGFLDRTIFCLFAEDVGLLPTGLFTRLVWNTRNDPERLGRQMGELFGKMAEGGDFGVDPIRHFNGNLFDGGAALELTSGEIESVRKAARLDWGAVDPSILGTLFERGLDPSKRSQLGAHYTSREDIETLVEPVVMRPLRREWGQIRTTCEQLMATGLKRPLKEGEAAKAPTGAALAKTRGEVSALLSRSWTATRG